MDMFFLYLGTNKNFKFLYVLFFIAIKVHEKFKSLT